MIIYKHTHTHTHTHNQTTKQINTQTNTRKHTHTHTHTHTNATQKDYKFTPPTRQDSKPTLLFMTGSQTSPLYNKDLDDFSCETEITKSKTKSAVSVQDSNVTPNEVAKTIF